MTIMEISLLILGVVIFVLSFVIPEKGANKSEAEIENERETIRSLMSEELVNVKSSLNEVADDSVNYAMEVAERSMEKVSNEKIMAINEYAGTVIDEITKNHQEVVFLYDMLQDKHTDLTNIVRKADATSKEMESLSEAALSTSESLRHEIDVMNVTSKGLTQQQKDIFASLEDEFTKNEDAAGQTDVTEEVAKQSNESEESFEQLSKDSFAGVRPVENIDPTMSRKLVEPKKVESASEENNNDKILKLHQMGMSTVDIAKELKLGVGEVKLVIDLFQ